MTNAGTVIEGKYRILEEIGRGGMSTVYLARDTHLNKNWAVKEVRKQGNGENDQIIINSLLAEADLVKRLDHPALPRIVDIIDNGVTIYIVMDFIEGESLDKVLAKEGPQPESKVIAWAMQVCDVFTYLHSQNRPIIYRDMKPANLMLKPNGNISIIDFGIAREFKEQGVSDTTVLGTRGYAPPEQYSGHTDPRSDIYALGMTMHHLLTGVDPRSGEPYKPVRQYKPYLTKAIEYIIDRCVQPASENRYQSAAELLMDLDLALRDPGSFTEERQRQLKIKRASFFTAVGFAILAVIAGVVLNIYSTKIKNSDYDRLIATSQVDNYYQAIDLIPGRPDAYLKVIKYYRSHESTLQNDDIVRIGNRVDNNKKFFDKSDPQTANLYYEMGKLYFAFYDAKKGDGGSTGDKDSELESRAKQAANFFEPFVLYSKDGKGNEENEDSEENKENDFTLDETALKSFDKTAIASCYNMICRFFSNADSISGKTVEEYSALFEAIKSAMVEIEDANNRESNFDKATFYYSVLVFMGEQEQYMQSIATPGAEETENLKNDANEIINNAFNKGKELKSGGVKRVENIKEKIEGFEEFVSKFSYNFDEALKQKQNVKQTNGGGK